MGPLNGEQTLSVRTAENPLNTFVFPFNKKIVSFAGEV